MKPLALLPRRTPAAVRLAILAVLAALGTAPLHAQRTHFDIDPGHSYVGFRVRHLMIATVRGRFETFAGKIVIDPRDTTRSSVEVEIETISVASGNARRDRDVRGESFLAVERYPRISFRSTRIERGAEGWRMAGDLTIRGVTRPVTIPFTLAAGSRRLGVTATLTIDREHFGMTAVPAATVGKEISIDIEVEANEVATPPGNAGSR